MDEQFGAGLDKYFLADAHARKTEMPAIDGIIPSKSTGSIDLIAHDATPRSVRRSGGGGFVDHFHQQPVLTLARMGQQVAFKRSKESFMLSDERTVEKNLCFVVNAPEADEETAGIEHGLI